RHHEPDAEVDFTARRRENTAVARLAQLVESTSLTRRGSGVRIPQRALHRSPGDGRPEAPPLLPLTSVQRLRRRQQHAIRPEHVRLEDRGRTIEVAGTNGGEDLRVLVDGLVLGVLDVLEVPELPGQDARAQIVQHGGEPTVAAALGDVPVKRVVELDSALRVVRLDRLGKLTVDALEDLEVAFGQIGEGELAGEEVERAHDRIELEGIEQRLDGDSEAAM